MTPTREAALLALTGEVGGIIKGLDCAIAFLLDGSWTGSQAREVLRDYANDLTRIGKALAAPAEPPRPCTCHPDDNPPRPCPQKFAFSECRAAAEPQAECLSAELAQFVYDQLDAHKADNANYMKAQLAYEALRAIASGRARVVAATEPDGVRDHFGYLRWTPTSCRRCGYEQKDCTCIGGFAAPAASGAVQADKETKS